MLEKKYHINLSSSEFAHYIEEKLLYVDKSIFIEHFMNNPSNVLLITRPRKMGKSLNMNMLAEFLDCKKSSAHLFKELEIGKTKTFEEHLNKYPVIYLDFKNLSPSCYKNTLREQLMKHINKYLDPMQYTKLIKKNIENEEEINLRSLTKNLYRVYKVKPIILINGYESLFMDSLNEPNHEEIKTYMSLFFESAFNDNPHIKKALLTGILRLSYESMFSKVSDIEAYDVFTQSEFNEDFGLTEKEVKDLVEPKDFKTVKKWYDGVRVGNSYVYYVHSVMSFLSEGKFSSYWGKNSNMSLLGDLLTQSKILCIGELVKKLGNTFTTELGPRISLKELLTDKEDKYYYALAVQAGYLSWDKVASINPRSRFYELCIPNEELIMVWQEYILNSLVQKEKQNQLAEIFEVIDNADHFNKELKNLLSFKLSLFDLCSNLEKTYHSLALGLMVDLGFDVSSNSTAGISKYDLFIETKEWTAVVEFKVSKMIRDIKEATKEALTQINRKKYLANACKNKPAYAIGIGTHKRNVEVMCERAW